jgi:tripartite-type tricarboxylate transporter receptor subunit TctC
MTMNITRRAVLGASLAAAALPALAYPTRPIRIVIGFGPGGLADIILRTVAAAMAEELGQQVVVDNRPGAGGALAAQAVSGAAPDGHTLILFTSGTSISRALFRNLPFDPVTQFTPVSAMAAFDALVLAPASSPITTLESLRGRRAPLTIATLTAGSTQHLTGEMFRLASGLDITLVPFRTSPEIMTALRRGDVDLAIESYGAAAGDLRAGALQALANTAAMRSPLLPAVPTIRESGFDCVMEGWNAIFAPVGTPEPVVAQLNATIRGIIARPAIQARLLELGVVPRANAPGEMAALLRDDIALWNGVIDRAGIERQ